MSKNDDAWNLFFERTSSLTEIRADGYCYVTADDLKTYGDREPRLMAKLDTRSVCPKIFRDNNLTIFPTRNGQYILFEDPEHKTYYSFPSESYESSPTVHRSAANLSNYDSYPRDQDLNEAQAVDFAHLAGLLQSFTRDQGLNLTIRGRSYSGDLEFSLPSSGQQIAVTSVQIEVDAGYESDSAIYLIEAKVGRRDDFNIRQLYYPYLEWSRRSSKRIIPIFLVYTNGIYYLTKFRFAREFGDLFVVHSASYAIDESPIATVDIDRVLTQTQEEAEPRVPYPQADDLDKVIDVVSAVEAGIDDKVKIAELFEFDERQGDYYANAARYLGFLERENRRFVVTSLGGELMRTKARQSRTLLMLTQLARRPTFRRALHLVIAKDFRLSQVANTEISSLIAAYSGLTGSTPIRRASTVRSWLAWILRNTTPTG